MKAKQKGKRKCTPAQEAVSSSTAKGQRQRRPKPIPEDWEPVVRHYNDCALAAKILYELANSPETSFEEQREADRRLRNVADLLIYFAGYPLSEAISIPLTFAGISPDVEKQADIERNSLGIVF